MGGGSRAHSRRRRRRRTSFNGASTTWSRMVLRPLDGSHVVIASTGPRPRGRGWQLYYQLVSRNVIELQRGLDHMVEDGCSSSPTVYGSIGLQRGLDHVVEDGRGRAGYFAAGGRSFNGASTTWSRMAPASGTMRERKEIA